MATLVNQAGWLSLRSRLAVLGKYKLHVGVLASQGGTALHGDITLVELAAIHEFGSPAAKIPERSFIRSTFQIRRVNALKTMQGKLFTAVANGTIDGRRALELLGIWGANEVKNTITEIDIPPPLRPATVDAKGSDKPLVDTGRLLGAITSEVVES